MKTYQDHVTEDRRLCILRLLAEVQGYSANESILHRAMEPFGHRVSRDQVKTDLAWLDEQGLVTVDSGLGIAVATLTQRGLDVAAGTAAAPGVKRPSPGS